MTYASELWTEPVDIVLDGVGGDLLPREVAAMAPGGRLVFFASSGGTVSAFDLLAGSKTITGMTMASFVRTNRVLYDHHGEQLWALMLEGQAAARDTRADPAIRCRASARDHRVQSRRSSGSGSAKKPMRFVPTSMNECRLPMRPASHPEGHNCRLPAFANK